MKSLSIDVHGHDPAHDQELYDLLKNASATPTKKVVVPTMDKEGQDPGESPGDDTSVQGVNPDQSDVDRPKDSIDAPWGEAGPKAVLQFSNEVSRQFRKNREDLIHRLFDGSHSSAVTEKKLLGKNLQHAAKGDFETSSLTLGPKTASLTLREKVRKLTGYR